MYTAVAEKPPIEQAVKIFTKNPDGSKKAAGELNVKFKQVSTDDIDRFIDEDMLPSEIYDEVVVEVGPVGHPTKKDESGNPVPLPAEEAFEAVRADWSAVQQILNQFWELNRVDPKSRTSKRRRRRG